MVLSIHNVCNYLIENGLVSLKSVVEGDLMVRDASSRNTNFLINQFAEGGKKLLVKQPDIDDEKYVQDMKIEADIYEIITKNSAFSKIRKYVPKIHHYDSQNYILVMEQLSGVCRVFDYQYHGPNYPDKVIVQTMATILAGFHSIPFNKIKNIKPTFPWFLEVADNNYYKKVKKDDKKAYKILKPFFENPEVMQFVKDAKAMWDSSHFIHLDTRLTNWLIPYSHKAGNKNPIWLIDFELAGMGDAAWDIGFLIGEFIYFDTYIQTNKINISPNEHYLTVADTVKCLWSKYTKIRAVDGAFKEKVVRYTAIKIFLIIYEEVVDEDDVTLSDLIRKLTELFFDMINNTEKYLKTLFGK
ncbi:MAG: phosphotransferase [Spirosomataceae bacterium]